ncbi:MAG: DNA polymerase III subunit beta, partial [Planctomycetota bacterium]
EFPDTGQFNEEKHHVVAAKMLKELIRRTIFATDSESSRYALGGVLLEFGEDAITAVGTDGRRLAKMVGEAKSVAGHLSTAESTTIVPARAMQLLERAIPDDDSEIKLAATSNELKMHAPNITLVSRLVEGRFPKWQEVLVERPDAKQIQVTVGPLYAAVRQASIVASEESRGIDFCFGNGSLVMSSTTSEVGESRVELPIPYEGDEITVSLDHRFVSDFLKVLGGDKSATLAVKDDENPAEFSTDDGYTYVVMPMARDGAKKG